MLFALMVMPRSRSRSMESRTCSCISRWVSAPVISSRRSASVDLPWSMCAMMQKFRMNFGSIFLAYQFAQLRAGFEWPAGFFRQACGIRTSDTRSAKTVPYKHSVCHNSKAASACTPITGEKKSGVTRTEPGNCGSFLAKTQSYLTGGFCRHRVSAILTRLRPVMPAAETLRSGQIGTEVIVAKEADSAVVPSEEKTIHKLRMRIIPFVFVLYIIAFLDRINIGFAALTMNKELVISSRQFGLVAGIFFLGYFLFEIPSNLLLHKLGARIWIARILITWGILATLTGLVRSVSQLYAVRFLLGLAEAGYFPGIALYLTYWFRQRDQAQAIALFLAGIPATSILGAPVSGFILDHAHWLSISSWRWLLILEGIPAVVCGVLTYFLLPNRHVYAELLDAAAGEITIERIFEQFDRTPGDDSTSCGLARNGDGVAEFRSQAREEISCGDSGHRRWNRSCAIGRDSFHFPDDPASILRCPRHLQRLWPFLLAPRRFPHGICGGLRDCPSEFGCESRRICRTVCDWLDKGPDRQFVRRPGGCRRFLVRISDTDVATSKRTARQPE